jgi:hypothetical protein
MIIKLRKVQEPENIDRTVTCINMYFLIVSLILSEKNPYFYAFFA